VAREDSKEREQMRHNTTKINGSYNAPNICHNKKPRMLGRIRLNKKKGAVLRVVSVQFLFDVLQAIH